MNKEYKKWYWLNKESRVFLERGYLSEGQTGEDRVREIAKHAEKLTGIRGFADKFEEYMSYGWFSLSSPVWANYGKERGMPVSCFGSYIEDDMASILEAIAEVGMLSKFGGGTSGYFGELRHRGAPIKDSGESSGSVHFMKLFDELSNTVSQGSVRRGYFSAYLPIEHEDFYEFIGIGTDGHPVQNITHGITVSDSFMKRMIEGDKEARKRWAKVIQSRTQTGIPYIFWEDTVNNNKPSCFKDKRIYASNMCVHPNTLVLTKDGYVRISSLKDKEVELWNGFEFTKTTVRKTGEDQEMLKVSFSDGSELVCTPYHKFFLKDSKLKRTSDLSVGDKLEKWSLPVLAGHTETNDSDMYSAGFYSAEGNTGYNWSWIYSPKFVCEKRLTGTISEVSKYNRKKWTHGALDKNFVPFNGYSVSSKLSWLAGLFDGDGTINKSKNGAAIQVSSVNKDFLYSVKLLLASIGCHSSISLVRDSGVYELPDGRNGLKGYVCKDVFRLNITPFEVRKLTSMGLKCERLQFSEKTPKRDSSYFVKVTSIEKVENADSYCFSDSLRNKGWFNGVVTGQCSEIAIPSSKDETFVCVLSSMNLLHWDEWKDTDAVKVLTIFLDSVCEEFIIKATKLANENTKAYEYISRAVNFCSRWRALGLGVLGWHSYLQSKMISFESEEASKINLDIFIKLKTDSLEVSGYLADKDGTSKEMKEFGRKNATLLAVAPTKSSSFILGGVSQGIEPELSNFYIKDLAKIKTTKKNKFLEAELKKLDLNNDDIWESIKDNDGSIQQLTFLPKHLRDVFKTFNEIDPYVVIDQAADRQKFIDQAQSLNIVIDSKKTAKDINKLYIYAWEKGIKTLYYQYGFSAAQETKREKNKPLECIGCEA